MHNLKVRDYLDGELFNISESDNAFVEIVVGSTTYQIKVKQGKLEVSMFGSGGMSIEPVATNQVRIYPAKEN